MDGMDGKDGKDSGSESKNVSELLCQYMMNQFLPSRVFGRYNVDKNHDATFNNCLQLLSNNDLSQFKQLIIEK